MKALTAFWNAIIKPGKSRGDELRSARTEHIGDLRILLDRADKREDELAGLVRMVMEERFYRPVVTASGLNRKAGGNPEMWNDVSRFGEEEDGEQIAAQLKRESELEMEFAQLSGEQAGSRRG